MERAGRAGRAGDDLVDGSVLVPRAQGGDEEAWDALVGRHLSLVHAVCRSYGLPDGAEVNQLVWLRLVEHLARIRTPDALGGWIAAVTRSLCLAPERSADRSGYVTAAAGSAPAGVAPGSSASAGAGVGEGARLAGAFARIGARCQRLLRLAATWPRPSAEAISAALDLAVADVEPACIACVDRQRHLAGTDAPDVVAELRRTLGDRDAVPEGWYEAARSAYTWLTLDAAPARRIYDSLTEVGPGATAVQGRSGASPAPGAGSRPVGVGARAVRQMRFSAPDDGVELAVDTDGDEVLLVGQLVSGRVVSVTARWPGGERTARTDEGGAFRFHGLPAAPLCVQTTGENPLKTGWILP